MDLQKPINTWNEWMGKAVSWLHPALILLICTDVFWRFIFRESRIWVMELEWHIFALIFLLGAGYTLKHDRHVRVDLFYNQFSERDKALTNLIGSLFLLIPWCLVTCYFSFKYAWQSFLIREGSPDAGGLPGLFMIKFAIPVGLFLLFLQAVSQAIAAIQSYKKN